MIENRRVRFATIEGIDRLDLPLAAEIWLEDLRSQSWTSRESVKLGGLFTRYMSRPTPEWLDLSYIDRSYHMDGKATLQALRLMQVYGVVEAFSCEKGMVRVSLNLTLLHRLRVLELRERLSVLINKPRPALPSLTAEAEDKWIPEKPVKALEEADSQG